MTTTHNGKQRATSEFKRNRAKLLADEPVCHWCGIARASEADHLLESDAGGDNSMSNLVPACKPCNARRGQAYRVRKERENNGVLEITTHSNNTFFSDDARKPPASPKSYILQGFKRTGANWPCSAKIGNDHKQ